MLYGRGAEQSVIDGLLAGYSTSTREADEG
jgi:hypothetical protein